MNDDDSVTIKLDRRQAEALVRHLEKNRQVDVMCKEYGNDDDWVAIEASDFDDDDGEYQTFEIWLPGDKL